MQYRPSVSWPNRARIAVNISVSFETWPEDLGTPASAQRERRRPFPPGAVYTKNLHTLTDRQFGERIGIHRVVDLFRRHGIKSTFFLNGITVERFPELARQLVAEGHELASETYIHDYSFMKSYEQDRADISRSIEAFERVLGQRPLGYLSTGHLPTDNTPPILTELGYRYWVDPSHEEMPYTLTVEGTDLTVLAYTWDPGDYATVGDDETTMRQVGEMWRDAFDWLYERGAEEPSRLPIVLHPWVAGRAYRMKVIEDFVKYVKGFPSVWICRLVDVVDWWRKEYRDAHVEEWPNYYGTERLSP